MYTQLRQFNTNVIVLNSSFGRKAERSSKPRGILKMFGDEFINCPLVRILAAVFGVFVLGSTVVIAEPCQVAALLSLTGSTAEYGVATKNGLLLAKEERDNVEYLFEDNRYEAAGAISAYRSVLASGNKPILFYNWGEIATTGLAPVSERDGNVLLAMSVDSRPAKGKRLVVRTLNPSREFVQKGLEYLKAKGLRRAVVFLAQDPFFEEQFQELKLQSSTEFALVKTLEFKPDEMDFRSGITSLRGVSFDVVFALVNPGQLSTFAKQFRKLGLQQQIVATDILESQSEIDHAEGALEGAICISPSVSPEFKQRYLSRFGEDIQVAYAFNAYRMGKVLSKVCSGDHSSAGSILTGLKDGAAEVENLSFVEEPDSGGYFQTPLVVRRVQGGKIVE